jgi:hypothetical protein
MKKYLSKLAVSAKRKSVAALLIVSGLISNELKATLKAEYKKKGFLTLLAEFASIIVVMPTIILLLLLLSEVMK